MHAIDMFHSDDESQYNTDSHISGLLTFIVRYTILSHSSGTIKQYQHIIALSQDKGSYIDTICILFQSQIVWQVSLLRLVSLTFEH